MLPNEFDYFYWLRAIIIALDGRSKMGVINDSIKSPDVDSPEYEAWLFKDQLVMSWILNLMDHNLAKVFSYLESFLDLWNVVHNMYDNQNNSARIF